LKIEKIKDRNGSALVLAIVLIALLSIFIVIITSQINNQIINNKNIYNHMKLKYAAESGIENSISDIENQIYQIISINKTYKLSTSENISHNKNDDCPKVNFKDGTPIIDTAVYYGNGFANLIDYQLMKKKADVIYNGSLYSNLQPILGNDDTLRKYYENNIRRLIENIAMGHISYNHIELETNINNFIEYIEKFKLEIQSKQGISDSQKQQAISGLNEMKGYMLEIKCRLNMTESEPTQLLEGMINIPYYSVSTDENNELILKSKQSRLVSIDIKFNKNDEIEYIDFTDLNKEFLESNSDKYKIKSDVDFIFVKNGNNYNIQQKINSYEKIN
jgi:hypothetical protein